MELCWNLPCVCGRTWRIDVTPVLLLWKRRSREFCMRCDLYSTDGADEAAGQEKWRAGTWRGHLQSSPINFNEKSAALLSFQGLFKSLHILLIDFPALRIKPENSPLYKTGYLDSPDYRLSPSLDGQMRGIWTACLQLLLWALCGCTSPRRGNPDLALPPFSPGRADWKQTPE